MKKTDNYASNQIRILLHELKNPSHKIKVKAIVAFRNYVETYQPDIADDNVDYLFLGDGSIDKTNNNSTSSSSSTTTSITTTSTTTNSNYGLLYWCGVKSDKHIGELKRICYPSIQLVRWLITHDVIELDRGNFYYTRFVQLSLTKLKLIDFTKHILSYNKSNNNNNNNKSSSSSSMLIKKSRNGNDDSCFVLLTIILNDYRTPEGKSNSIEVDELLNYNDTCHKKYDEWQDANKTNEVCMYDCSTRCMYI